jgi:integrase/recombinase XerD
MVTGTGIQTVERESSFLEGTRPLPDGSFESRLEVVQNVLSLMDVSEETRTQYNREIVPFLMFLDKSGGRFYPSLLLDWKRHLERRKDIGTGTKNKYLTVGRVLLRELHRLYPSNVPDLTSGIKSFRVTKVHKRVPMSDEEVRTVWGCLESKGASYLRTKVIVGLMYYQGLRRVEVSRLQVEDFNTQERTLLVLGKGRDDKETVDVHPRMVEVLTDYLTEMDLRSGWLFPSKKNVGMGLSPNMIWRLVMGIHRELGITKNVHSYRKVFTSRLIQSGMNLLDVRTYTRHRDITQLQTYYDRIERTKTLPMYYDSFD